LLSHDLFIRRVLKFALISLGLAAFSLLLGILGYRIFEGMGWIDAYMNAAMILGGMGPVNELRTNTGKLFAGSYALYCGLVVLISMGILIAPILHRFLHRFHLEDRSED
jgi:hypothetical protein